MHVSVELAKERRLSARHQGVNLLEAMRPHHWTKNLLVFLFPAMHASTIGVDQWAAIFAVFVLFNACASGVYLFNDLADMHSDRQHDTKRHRPIASRELNTHVAFWAAVTLTSVSSAFAFAISEPIGLLMVTYLFVATSYTLLLKRLIVIDVGVLALKYCLRILAGAMVIGASVPGWLIAYSFFFFLSLACIKRHAELLRLKPGTFAAGRGYTRSHASVTRVWGHVSGAISASVLGGYAYLIQPQDGALFGVVLTLLSVQLLWMFRIWQQADVQLFEADPVKFVLCDFPSQIGFILCLILTLNLALEPLWILKF